MGRIEKEKNTNSLMINIYCKKKAFVVSVQYIATKKI